uniref:Ubiquitin-conjugating enzyme E2 Z n=1 Tax=viral metagenome TaxID=1070528 RepID=A0A6C0BXD6_9ZZZZ
MTEVVLAKGVIKRLAKDVREITRNPLIEHGIHYVHNTDNILKGQALCVGSKGTPYENGYYLFEFEFPPNYPHAPPLVTYHTNDGKTRFNPNYYRNGKVCLSILNTWSGDQWSSCNTISSILLALCTVLNDKPLLNEPGIKEDNKDFTPYNKIITFANLSVAIGDMLEKNFVKVKFPELRKIMVDHFKENYNSIMEQVYRNVGDHDSIATTRLYGMTMWLDYSNVGVRLTKIYEGFVKELL